MLISSDSSRLRPISSLGHVLASDSLLIKCDWSTGSWRKSGPLNRHFEWLASLGPRIKHTLGTAKGSTFLKGSSHLIFFHTPYSVERTVIAELLLSLPKR